MSVDTTSPCGSPLDGPGMLSFACRLAAGHTGPHAAPEAPRSLERRAAWERTASQEAHLRRAVEGAPLPPPQVTATEVTAIAPSGAFRHLAATDRVRTLLERDPQRWPDAVREWVMAADCQTALLALWMCAQDAFARGATSVALSAAELERLMPPTLLAMVAQSASEAP